MGGIGIITGIPRLSCRFDSRPSFLVMLCQTVGGALRRSGLQVIQIAVLFLVISQSFTHMVQYFLRKILRLFSGHIISEPVGVKPYLIHSDQADS